MKFNFATHPIVLIVTIVLSGLVLFFQNCSQHSSISYGGKSEIGLPESQDDSSKIKIKQIFSGGSSAYAIDQNGDLLHWGVVDGQDWMNLTNDEVKIQKTPRRFSNLKNILYGDAGGYGHACVVNDEGMVYCWGENRAGALGNGTTTRSEIPVRAGNLIGIKLVRVGYDFTCAIHQNSEVSCWGAGVLSPLLMPGLQNIVSLAAVYDQPCAMNTIGNIFCWKNGIVDSVRQMVAFSKSIQIQGSINGELCSLNQNKLIECIAVLRDAAPLTVTQVGPVSSLSNAGYVDARCGLYLDKSARCWGSNGFGLLGVGLSGTDFIATEPQKLAIENVQQISMGHYFSCLLTNEGQVYCWGWNSWNPVKANDDGALPSDASGFFFNTPQRVVFTL